MPVSVLYKNKEIRNLLNLLRELGDVCIVGGVARDYILYKNHKNIRDVDIVVDLKDANNFDNILCKYKYIKNSFGGYKLTINNIDVWDINLTYYINEKFFENNINMKERFVNTPLLNIDSILYDINNNKIYGKLKIYNKIIDLLNEYDFKHRYII